MHWSAWGLVASQPLALQLLPPLALLMAVDLFQTLKGLQLGFGEANVCAAACLRRFGVSGLAIYQAGCFWLVALPVLVWPEQWLGPSLICFSIATVVAQNARLLASRSGRVARVR